MSRDTKIESRLAAKLHGSSVRAAMVQGGWLVEIVFPGLTFNNRNGVFNTVEFEIRSALHPNPQIFWKIFIYKSKRDRYLVDGTLHTIMNSYTPDGHEVVTLDAGDAIVLLTEFDGEMLLLSDYSGLKVEMSEAISPSSKQPILPFIPQSSYLWLETQGGHYGLAPDVEVTVLSATTPKELEITLRT